jgi:cell division protein FtsB
MAIFHEVRDRARLIAPPVLIFCLVAYFAYHVVQGERGLLAWVSVKHELAEARATQTALTATRADLQRRVDLLARDGLDLDMLEERAHEVLNYGRDDEVIILLPNGRGTMPQ